MTLAQGTGKDIRARPVSTTGDGDNRAIMGVARSIEQRLEGLVEGFFTKLFRSGLQPVEVGRRILREMAEGKTVSVNRIYVPNEFEVTMGAEDHARFVGMEGQLVREFSDLVIDEAKQNRWNLMGVPLISFQPDDKMGRGEFKVEASLAADASLGAPRASTHEPAGDADPSLTRAISLDSAQRLGFSSRSALLEVLGDSGEVKERISLASSPVTVGRLSINDIVLGDSNVSRRHAEFRSDGGQWVLTDLGSTNGSLINGKPVTQRQLKDGDRLTFGSTDLVFRTQAS
jgi:FhaA, N-terminal domain/FHA domain